MYDYMLLEMAGVVAEKTGCSRSAAAEALLHYWSDKAAIVWTAEDVLYHAVGLDKKCTKAQACDILKRTVEGHEGTLGVTADSFDRLVFDLPDSDLVGVQDALKKNGIDSDLESGQLTAGRYSVDVTRYDGDGLPTEWGVFDSETETSPVDVSDDPMNLVPLVVSLFAKNA